MKCKESERKLIYTGILTLDRVLYIQFCPHGNMKVQIEYCRRLSQEGKGEGGFQEVPLYNFCKLRQRLSDALRLTGGRGCVFVRIWRWWRSDYD